MDMKYRISYLPKFDQDILRIGEALADYPNKAKRLFQEIEKKLRMLESMPYIWPAYNANPKYRQMVLEDHLLFYLIDENTYKVKIYRILYSKMDIPKHFE